MTNGLCGKWFYEGDAVVGRVEDALNDNDYLVMIGDINHGDSDDKVYEVRTINQLAGKCFFRTFLHMKETVQ